MVWVAAALVAGTTGCSTICDEVADEAEASGCAVGAPESGESVEPVDCAGDLEKRAQCLLDNTENVCSITEAEAQKVADCIGK
jgi:hypothetical protein